MTTQEQAPDLLSVDARRWSEARRCLPLIRDLAERPLRTRADVEMTAEALGCGPTHLYRLLRRYTLDPRLTSLLPRPPGPHRGLSRSTAELDELVERAIQGIYLTHQRPRIADLVRAVRQRCQAVGLTPPGRKAITTRLRAKPQREILARRKGLKAARDRYAPATGSLEASWPLSLVQIDHTLVDVMVVDSQTRLAIQRPWLTLAIDVCTRCVAGFYLSLDPPSAASVALCIAHACLPKAAWLSARHIEGRWPVHGLIARLHLDNGKEFHSEALRRGCEQYGIGIDYRPVRTPHYGGHIERLIGTMMGKVHLLPGTTFSNVQDKGEYDPAKTAAMTLEELERWLALDIVSLYHGGVHAALGTTPLAAWDAKILGSPDEPGCGETSPVTNPRRFLLDFLPFEQRLIRREGVSLHSIRYWSDVLTSWVGDPEKRLVRYDPRDLSRVYLLGPDGAYYDLTYRDLRHPPISLWEQRIALKRLREAGRTHVDERAIFRAVETMRHIVDEAVMKSKAARRHQARRERMNALPAHGIPAPVHLRLVSNRDAETPYAPEPLFPIEEWDSA